MFDTTFVKSMMIIYQRELIQGTGNKIIPKTLFITTKGLQILGKVLDNILWNSEYVNIPIKSHRKILSL